MARRYPVVVVGMGVGVLHALDHERLANELLADLEGISDEGEGFRCSPSWYEMQGSRRHSMRTCRTRKVRKKEKGNRKSGLSSKAACGQWTNSMPKTIDGTGVEDVSTIAKLYGSKRLNDILRVRQLLGTFRITNTRFYQDVEHYRTNPSTAEQISLHSNQKIAKKRRTRFVDSLDSEEEGGWKYTASKNLLCVRGLHSEGSPTRCAEVRESLEGQTVWLPPP